MRRKRSLILSIVLVVATFLAITARKIFDFAAAPDKEKESDFVFPPNPDQGKALLLAASPQPPLLALKQRGGFTNDASHLNKTAIYGIVKITSEDDIRNALEFARENNLKVTCRGSNTVWADKHSRTAAWCSI